MSASELLPPGSVQAPNNAGQARYIGAAPPKGSPDHHYYVTVTALDIARIDLPATASPALLDFTIGSHALARGYLTATAAAS